MVKEIIVSSTGDVIGKLGVGNGGGTTRKEQAAAEIMATLKPSAAADGVATAAAKGNPQKKRKIMTGGMSSPPPPPAMSSLSASVFKKMDDSEFVRAMALEFKRRGYTVAIQLTPEADDSDTAKATKKSPQKGESESGEATADPSSEKPKAAAPASSKRAKKKVEASPTPLPSFTFYPSTVTHSQKKIDSWNKMFEKLRTFHSENNGALPLHTQPNSEHASLSKWTKTQLTLWKRMKRDSKHNLSLDRIAKLHSLDLERGAQLQQDIKNCALLEGVDDAKLMEQMAMIGPSGKNAQKWQDKFDALKRYSDEHGDTNVSRKHDDALSKWCAVQRMRCKLFRKGDKKVPMTQAQFQALESIGFNMDRQRKLYDRSVLEKNWEEKYNELLEYKEKFGNTDVAVRKGFEEYKKLANWAGLQRQKYRAKQTGTSVGRTTEITDDQIKKLALVGFSFSLQDDFETRFKNLLEFKKEFGHTKVPVFYTGYNNLGRWAKRMRDGIRNNEPWMDEVKKTRLLGIDFDIAARHVFGHKPKKKPEDDNEDDDMDDIEEVGEPVEAQAVAAATTMAGMDNNDYNRPNLPPFGNMGSPQFFYQGYPQAPP